MKSVLHVGAVVDSRTPAAWVIQLLKNIDGHELMQLDVVIKPVLTNTTINSGLSNKFRLDDWLLHKVVDFPHFSNDPWKPDALPAAMTLTTLACGQLPDQIPGKLSDQTPGKNVLDTCDVILNLTASTVVPNAPPDVPPNSSSPVWSANLAVLDQRIKHCLLSHAPFIWIHLWEMQRWECNARQCNQTLANHYLYASPHTPCLVRHIRSATCED